MKAKQFLLFVFILSVISCSDNIENIDLPQNFSTNELKAATNKLTNGEWETWETIKLANLSNPVVVPWAGSNISISVPEEIRTDIKKEDGWILWENAIAVNQPSSNYLIFYNELTGILKVFYYLESATAGNNGFWQIDMGGGESYKSFYNNVGYLSRPYNDNTEVTSSISIMNLTKNSTKGFTVGWNAFEVELARRIPSNAVMTISAYQQTVSKINLKGGFQSSSEGTLIATPASNTNSTNKFVSGSATILNDSVGSWLKSNLTSNITGKKGGSLIDVGGNILQNLITGNTSTLIDKGLHLVFGSFLGKSGASLTDYKLNFKTTGDINLEGTIQTVSVTQIPPITISNPPSGLWNLLSAPEIILDNYAKLYRAYVNPYPNNGNLLRYSYVIAKTLPQLNLSDFMFDEEMLNKYKPTISIRVYSVLGHPEGEVYSPKSKENAELRSGIYKLRPDSYLGFNRYATRYIYNDENGVKKGEVKISVINQIDYITSISGTTVDPSPNFMTNSGYPVVSIASLAGDKQLNIETEDIKVELTFTYNIDGKMKKFVFTRTYEPKYKNGYVRLTESCRPRIWTVKDLDPSAPENRNKEWAR